MESSANSRINNLWERSAIGLLTFIVSCMFVYQSNQREDYKALEEKVLTMQTAKVNKEDLKDTEARLNSKIDASISNLISRSASDKQDILQRMDLYWGSSRSKR